MEVTRIHPHDFREMLRVTPTEDLLYLYRPFGAVEVNGVTYVEDRTVPYKRLPEHHLE